MQLPQQNKSKLEYVKESLFLARMPTDGVIVLDVNIQGIFELSPHQKDFIDCFPETYKAFMKLCRDGEVVGGEAIKFVEDNYIIYLLVTAERVAGRDQDKMADIETNTSFALDSMFRDLESHHDTIYSGVLNRGVSAWSFSLREINSMSDIYPIKKWIVCTQ